MIGKEILEEEQQGQERAKYGSDLINKLSKKLTVEFGKGFTARNLWQMRKFYELYSIPHALRAELSWTHFRSLMKIEDPKKRSFYEIETISNNWSTRELERQINSLLYERLAISKDKNAVQELAIKGQELLKPEDLVKDPYILEFLGLPQSEKFFEADLESALIEHLQKFLLELGKGFSFVARQKRISLDDENFYIDLVFYNYIVKCFVLLDLKIGKLTHQDIGQMQMYDKSEAVVKYTLADDNRQIFASKYQLHLPTEEELREELIKEKDILEAHLDASFGDTLNVH
jgi:predicted nuclease of restriction endonuclease-like (RecB) superfamily